MYSRQEDGNQTPKIDTNIYNSSHTMIHINHVVALRASSSSSSSCIVVVAPQQPNVSRAKITRNKLTVEKSIGNHFTTASFILFLLTGHARTQTF